MLPALLITSSAAGASTYPGERPATDPLVSQAADIGQAFWRARGVTPCPAPEILVASSLLDDDGDPVGRAEVGGRTIWLARDFVRAARVEPPHQRGEVGGSIRELLCLAITHELGHTAGLEHDAGAVMAGYATPWSAAYGDGLSIADYAETGCASR